jgi:uncharacterized metal-binding protein YceD (DUF177 family)
MGKFDAYKVPLKTLSAGTHNFEYLLDDDYFKKIDSPEVQKGNVKANVLLKKTSATYELVFQVEGVVLISCDRCLDEMEQNITYKGKLFVKFGSDYSQESDEIVVVPESDGYINIAWFLYEFIVLSIPAKHVHQPGGCNKMMTGKLKKHLVSKDSDEDSDGFDDFDADIDLDFDDAGKDTNSHWDDLKNIIDNN